MSNKCLKAINFDLDTKKLKLYYPSSNYRQAYRDIKKYLENNGFKHRQFSGYISKTSMKHKDIVDIVATLDIKFSWFSKCVRRFDVTNIGKEHDMMKYINGNSTKAIGLSINKNSPLANKSDEPKKSSLLKKLDEKKAEIKKSEKAVNLSNTKNKNNIEI